MEDGRVSYDIGRQGAVGDEGFHHIELEALRFTNTMAGFTRIILEFIAIFIIKVFKNSLLIRSLLAFIDYMCRVLAVIVLLAVV